MEADAYWCLSKLLDSIQDHYTFAQPGIQRMVFKLKEIVARIDAPLHAHLAEQGLSFIQFAFRWMNCLLMRELSLDLIYRVWDTYLAEVGGTDDTNAVRPAPSPPTYPHAPSRTLTHPHAPSRTLTHLHAPSRTLTHTLTHTPHALLTAVWHALPGEGPPDSSRRAHTLALALALTPHPSPLTPHPSPLTPHRPAGHPT